jgi:hypothetical protein
MNLFTVTAPLTIKYPNGHKKIIIEKFQHKQGLLFFEPFWHINGLNECVHLIHGELTGEGPWKIDAHIITVTGCQGTDPEMASALGEWQAFLGMPEHGYPGDDEIRHLAEKLGAVVSV